MISYAFLLEGRVGEVRFSCEYISKCLSAGCKLQI